MTNEQTAADRIRKFIDEYTKMRGLHPEMVYEIHAGDDHRHAAITISDLEALLAQPEPEGPTDIELLSMAGTAIGHEIEFGEYEPETECAVEAYGSELIDFARAVLARWGRPRRRSN